MNDIAALDHALRLIAEGTLSIDAEGRIWRHAVLSHGKRMLITARRAESVGGNGYLRVMMQIDGRLRGIGAHRLVWIHFNGSIPVGMQINHIDLNKRNNVPSNLEVVTGSENIQHSYANGRRRPWSSTTEWRGKRILTAEDIANARAMRRGGALLRVVAEHFAISTTHAQRITS